MKTHTNTKQTTEDASLFVSSINVEQWRQDIQTFADTTQQMLDTINDELSNGFAQGTTTTAPKPPAVIQLAGPRRTTSNSQAEQASTPENEADKFARQAVANVEATNAEDNCNQLLASLKKQLAEQLELG